MLNPALGTRGMHPMVTLSEARQGETQTSSNSQTSETDVGSEHGMQSAGNLLPLTSEV